MRIVSANIRHGLDAHGKVGQLRQVGRQLAQLNPDVVTVQEVDFRQTRSRCTDQLGLLVEGLGWHRLRARMYSCFAGQAQMLRLPAVSDLGGAPWWAPDRLASTSGPLLGGYGVALASRHPVVAWRHLRLGAAPARLTRPGAGRGLLGSGWGVYFGQNRGLLAADLVIAGRPVRVGTTHLELGQATARQQLYRSWSMLHRHWEAPAFLTGDFNLEAQAVQQITGVAAAADATAKTFPAANPTATIDHVLCPGPQICRVRQIRTQALAVGDHRALIVDVDFVDAPAAAARPAAAV